MKNLDGRKTVLYVPPLGLSQNRTIMPVPEQKEKKFWFDALVGSVAVKFNLLIAHAL